MDSGSFKCFVEHFVIEYFVLLSLSFNKNFYKKGSLIGSLSGYLCVCFATRVLKLIGASYLYPVIYWVYIGCSAV